MRVPRPGRETIAKFLVAIILVSTFSGVGFVLGETFLSSFYVTTGPIHHNATNGPEVVQTKDYNLQSGNPFTSTSYNLSTETNGWINVSGDAGTVVSIDQIHGTYTNASSIDGSAGDITLDPDDKNETTVGGGVTSIKFKDVRAEVDETQLTYSATGGDGKIEVRTNATDGTQYGLIDRDTNEGLAVGVADANGVITFQNVESGTHDVRIDELGTLFIRNELAPHDKITNAEATVRFFEDEDDNPTIIERTTNNGEIDLTGLPVDEQFIVTVRATGYQNRNVIIEDLSQQETVFVLNESEPALLNRFVIEDRTGDFPASETQLIIQKAINRTEFDEDPPGFAWLNIMGDDLGADASLTANLSQSDRYRIIVENEDGDRRIAGSRTVETAGTIEIRIGQVTASPESDQEVAWSASWDNSTPPPTITFEYNDTTDSTETLWVTIYEYQNESNVIFTNASFSGPLGSQIITQNVPSDEQGKTWVVDFTTDRGDKETISGSETVGPRQPLPFDLPPWLAALISIGTIWIIAGLFSQLNGDIGALVVAGIGGMFWFVDFLPGDTGVGVVVLAMITAGIIFINERRSSFT